MAVIDPWELGEWDAVETAARLRRGEISRVEVIEAACTRVEASRALGAMVTEAFDRARREALGAEGPLAGVPTFIKDLAQIEGVRTAWGSGATGTYTSRRTDPIAGVFAAAGLVTLGKSATPEFGLTATTEPLAFGPCKNPWDLARSTGGSSGGAAALVAAGVVPIAHASDGGGSIRIPAACCGLVGLKASRGRLDMEGSSLLPVNIAVNGVVTRTVRDTVAFWSALEGRRRVRLPPIAGALEAPTRRLRIGFFVDSPRRTPVDPEAQRVVQETAATCTALGHQVRAIDCPFESHVVDDFVRLWSFVAWIQARLGRVLTHRGFDERKLEPFTLGFARAFTQDRLGAATAMARLRKFPRRYAEILAPYDVLLCPTLATPAPLLGHLRTDGAFEETFARLLEFTPFTGLVNVAGAPALTLPLGRTTANLPIGVQFLGAHGEDRLLLELGAELEAAQPWPRSSYRG